MSPVTTVNSGQLHALTIFTGSDRSEPANKQGLSAVRSDRNGSIDQLGKLADAACKGDITAFGKFSELYSKLSTENEKTIRHLDGEIGDLSASREKNEAEQIRLAENKVLTKMSHDDDLADIKLGIAEMHKYGERLDTQRQHFEGLHREFVSNCRRDPGNALNTLVQKTPITDSNPFVEVATRFFSNRDSKSMMSNVRQIIKDLDETVAADIEDTKQQKIELQKKHKELEDLCDAKLGSFDQKLMNLANTTRIIHQQISEKSGLRDEQLKMQIQLGEMARQVGQYFEVGHSSIRPGSHDELRKEMKSLNAALKESRAEVASLDTALMSMVEDHAATAGDPKSIRLREDLSHNKIQQIKSEVELGFVRQAAIWCKNYAASEPRKVEAYLHKMPLLSGVFRGVCDRMGRTSLVHRVAEAFEQMERLYSRTHKDLVEVGQRLGSEQRDHARKSLMEYRPFKMALDQYANANDIRNALQQQLNELRTQMGVPAKPPRLASERADAWKTRQTQPPPRPALPSPRREVATEYGQASRPGHTETSAISTRENRPASPGSHDAPKPQAEASPVPPPRRSRPSRQG